MSNSELLKLLVKLFVAYNGLSQWLHAFCGLCLSLCVVAGLICCMWLACYFLFLCGISCILSISQALLVLGVLLFYFICYCISGRYVSLSVNWFYSSVLFDPERFYSIYISMVVYELSFISSCFIYIVSLALLV